MYNPPHPGKILKEEFIIPLNLTVTKTAKALKVKRQTLSELVNEHNGISPEMAIRISKVFNSNPELWLSLQFKYDLWKASKKEIKVEPLVFENNISSKEKQSVLAL